MWYFDLFWFIIFSLIFFFHFYTQDCYYWIPIFKAEVDHSRPFRDGWLMIFSNCLHFFLSLGLLIVWNITWIDGRRGTHSLGHYNNNDNENNNGTNNNHKANATKEIKYTSILILKFSELFFFSFYCSFVFTFFFLVETFWSLHSLPNV